MRWLCWFSLCPWAHLFNARQDGFMAGGRGIETSYVVGVYQCPRCKTLSLGAPRRTDGSVVKR